MFERQSPTYVSPAKIHFASRKDYMSGNRAELMG